MERMKILFYGTDRSHTVNHTIETYVNSFEEIFIQIQDTETMDNFINNGCKRDKTTICNIIEIMFNSIYNLNKK